MTKWPVVPLGDVLEPQSDPVDVEPYDSYRIGGIYSFGRGFFERAGITGGETKYARLFRVHSGQFVYSKLKAWEGALAIAEPEHEGLHVSSEFPTFDLDRSRLDTEFLAHLIRWEGFIRAISATTTGIGARRERVSPTQMLETRVPLPPLDEQRRISARLHRSTNAVEAAVHAWRKGEQLATTTVSALLKCAAVDAPEIALEEVLHERRAPIQVKPDSTYRTAGVFSFARGLFWRGSQPGSDIKYSTLYSVRPGQLVMSKLFAWEGALTIAEDSFDGALVSPEFPTFDIDSDRVAPGYLRAVIGRESFYRSLGVSGMGNRRQRVSPSTLLATKVKLPALKAQEKIAAAEASARKIGALMTRQAEIATAVGPAMLNEVFRGRL